jgi:hypothetical protein
MLGQSDNYPSTSLPKQDTTNYRLRARLHWAAAIGSLATLGLITLGLGVMLLSGGLGLVSAPLGFALLVAVYLVVGLGLIVFARDQRRKWSRDDAADQGIQKKLAKLQESERAYAMGILMPVDLLKNSVTFRSGPIQNQTSTDLSNDLIIETKGEIVSISSGSTDKKIDMNQIFLTLKSRFNDKVTMGNNSVIQIKGISTDEASQAISDIEKSFPPSSSPSPTS